MAPPSTVGGGECRSSHLVSVITPSTHCRDNSFPATTHGRGYIPICQNVTSVRTTSEGHLRPHRRIDHGPPVTGLDVAALWTDAESERAASARWPPALPGAARLRLNMLAPSIRALPIRPPAMAGRNALVARLAAVNLAIGALPTTELSASAIDPLRCLLRLSNHLFNHSHDSSKAKVNSKVLDCVQIGGPNGIRTRATSLKGWRPRPLDDRATL